MKKNPPDGFLNWFEIARLGLVQMMLGSVVVLTTSTMNRVIVVELALPAMLPGIFVGIHYAIQVLRPRWGHSTDQKGARTPWVVGGMVVLATGGLLAAVATAWMASNTVTGILLGLVAFLLIGIGVGASGTNLLVLLATHVSPRRRAAAASLTWMMMIAGFVITAIVAGNHLDPFTTLRLIEVTAAVCAVAVIGATLAVWGVERRSRLQPDDRMAPETRPQTIPFRTALLQVWAEPGSRRFATFVFVAMLAYSAQDLILEPFAGAVFGMTPGESTRLAGVQNGGVLLGMLVVALAASAISGPRLGSLKLWTVVGCLASGAALLGLAIGGIVGTDWPLRGNVFILGFSNGVFAVAAIGSMMGLAGKGRQNREGVRMGLWGAAQAIAFGIGGLIGTAAVDLSRSFIESTGAAYSVVFALEAILFALAALMSLRMSRSVKSDHSAGAACAGSRLAADSTVS